MQTKLFLKNLFKAYYQENSKNIPEVSQFSKREFAFLPWEKPMMRRHLQFIEVDKFKEYLIKNAPMHSYCSGATYSYPDNLQMQDKGYLGCDLLFDIDVDHFYTPCKDKHDLWQCKECGESGKGMIEKCPKCGKFKITRLSWICEECLNVAKNEIIKLVNDFLVPDFSINEDLMHIAFSGHRGYHLKIEDPNLRYLTSEERRDIIDYITGGNLSFELLGLNEKSSGTIFGLLKDNMGWSRKIMQKLEELLTQDDRYLEFFLRDPNKANLNQNLVKSFLNYKNEFLSNITSKENKRAIWAIEGFTLNKWKILLKAIVNEVGVEVDEPVSIDIHRLIRYPGTLHGKTGFKVQELNYDELLKFNPLNEPNPENDPIVFESKKKLTQKVQITKDLVPKTNIKGETYGEYTLGEQVEIPHHVAVFLLSKGVAKII
jgi:DNA primase small subunit